MKAITMILACFLSFGCKVAAEHIPPPPEPMVDGKCVVMKYRTNVPAESVCLLKGYKYACTEDAVRANYFWCENKGEATGEMSK